MAETSYPILRQPGGVLGLFVGLFLVVALPLLWVDLPPLVDYPNHLARMHILARWDESAWLQSYYAINWRPLPNLAMDLIVPQLVRFMPLAAAGKVFLLLVFLLLAGGPLLLHRVLFGRWSVWPCLVFLLLYNRVFLWGFLNYLFGLGLAFWALAAWIGLRERLVTRLAVATILSIALYASHFLAFGLWAVMAASFDLGVRIQERRLFTPKAVGELLLSSLPFIPSLAIFVLTASGGAGSEVSFGNPLRKFDLPFSLFDNYSRPFDVVCFVGIVLLFIWVAWRGSLRIHQQMRWPLILMLVTYLAMPSRLMTATGADHRIPLALALLFLGSTETLLQEGGRRVFAWAVGCLFVLRMTVIYTVWVTDDRDYAPLLAALDKVPEGASLAVAFPPSAIHADRLPVLHLPTLAIVRRDAFVPTLFAYPTQQPVSIQSRVRHVAEKTSPSILWSVFVTESRGKADAALERFDYLVFVNRGPFKVTPSPLLESVFQGDGMQLFRIVK